MKIKLLSDLHTEFWSKGFTPGFMHSQNDVLVLAGDIAVGKKNVEKILADAAKVSNHVIYVAGNHEYYGHNMEELNDLNLPKNVHFLNPGFVRISDVTFIGATLWTDFRNIKGDEQIASKYITDFKRIRGFDTQKCKELYNYHHDYILKAVKDIPGKKIIVTHFLPGMHCVDKKYLNQGFPTDQLNSYFAPEPNIPTTEVSYWLFGHTHESVAVMKDNTKYISNPFGYEGYETNKRFNSEFTFNVY